MVKYDFCFAWNWEYDADFAVKLAQACQVRAISLLQVTPDILAPVVHGLNERQLRFRILFDRATDADETYAALYRWALRYKIVTINRHLLSRRAWNKATMHRKIVRAGLPAPFSITLPPYNKNQTISKVDLSRLGEYFAIKPVHGGGGSGVITGATDWEQVIDARREYPNDHYLLQAQVNPASLDQRPAWFRVIYCAGNIHPFWWEPVTHRYQALRIEEIVKYNLYDLQFIVTRLAGLCKLELFSTEIAYTDEGQFWVVDYVNDPIDLRPQSKAFEGIPDDHLDAIAHELAFYVAGLLEK